MTDSIDFTSEHISIAADHPCLPGHFPGQPVVPAVVGLQAVTDILQVQRPEWSLQGISQAKFMSPLLPGESFIVSLRGDLPNIGFQCHVGERLIAKGILQVALNEPEEG